MKRLLLALALTAGLAHADETITFNNQTECLEVYQALGGPTSYMPFMLGSLGQFKSARDGSNRVYQIRCRLNGYNIEMFAPTLAPLTLRIMTMKEFEQLSKEIKQQERDFAQQEAQARSATLRKYGL